MSVDAGITIRLVSALRSEAILKAILGSSWTRGAEGWHCIPLGEDPSEWTCLEGHVSDLEALFRAKLKAGEIFGIRRWWNGGEIGGEFLFLSPTELLFSPSINRVTLDDRTTDVSWYIRRILAIFGGETGVVVEGWVWRETT